VSAIDPTAAIEAAARASWDDARDRLALAPGGYQPPAWEDASDMTRALRIEAARVPVIAAAEVVEAAMRAEILADIAQARATGDLGWVTTIDEIVAGVPS